MTRRAALVVLLVAALAAAGLHGAQSSRVRELTLFHFNDLHARLLPDGDGLGGFAHMATLLRREREAAGPSLTLNGGDLVQGTPLSTIFAGVPIFELAGFLGVDVNTLGNHEFDYGWQAVVPMTSAAPFPTIATNVVNAAGERLIAPAYAIREVDGIRVAIVGALLERTGPWGPWQSGLLLPTLSPVIDEVRAQADLVVVLGHIEHSEMQRILERLPAVDVVVAGHPHGGLAAPIVVDGRIGVNVQSFGREIGRLRLRVDLDARRVVAHEWTRLRVDSRVVPADPDTASAIARWESRLSAILDVPIGRASRTVLPDEVRSVVQQALVDQTGADLGYYNRIGVRDAIPQGELLARHMWKVSPLDDRAVTLELTGHQLLDLLDPAQPPTFAGGAAIIDPAKRYLVATSDFIAERWTTRAPGIRPAGTQFVADLLIEWTRRRQVIP